MFNAGSSSPKRLFAWLTQGYHAVQLLHTALGSPSMPQATPAPPTRGVKTFQKAKSLLSFRHQSSSASASASFGPSMHSMLPAAQPMPVQGKASSLDFLVFWAPHAALGYKGMHFEAMSGHLLCCTLRLWAASGLWGGGWLLHRPQLL